MQFKLCYVDVDVDVYKVEYVVIAHFLDLEVT